MTRTALHGSSLVLGGSGQEKADKTAGRVQDERRRNHRHKRVPRVVASLAAFVLVQGVSVVGQGNKTPLTPWGEPDLQGTWTAEAELSVPFERPREYGTRQVLSDAEFKQRETQSERQLQSDNSDFDLETADRSTAGQVGSAT